MLHGVHRSAQRQVVCLLFVALLAFAACGGEAEQPPTATVPVASFPTPETVPGIYAAIHTSDFSDSEHEDSEFRGTLLMVDGCLVIDPEWGDGPILPVWNQDHRLQVQGDDIAVVNGDGEPVARVGYPLSGGGNPGPTLEQVADDLFFPIPDTCHAAWAWLAIGIRPLSEQPVIPTPVAEGALLGLHTVAWPVDFAGAGAIVSALPDALDGLERQDVQQDAGQITVVYGPPG